VTPSSLRRRRRGKLALKKEKADVAWRQKVKERAGFRCEKCGREVPVLHAHHFVSRNYARLRFDVRNGVALCPRDHLFGPESAHKGGPFFIAWFQKHRLDDYEYLMDPQHRKPLEQNRTEFDYDTLCERLAA
jgi:hypothetical protein